MVAANKLYYSLKASNRPSFICCSIIVTLFTVWYDGFCSMLFIGKEKWMTVSRLIARLSIIGYLSVVMPATVSAGVFDNYSGNWRGTGEVVLKNNRRETITCKIKSTIEVDGTRAYYKVKCKSDNNKINVRINLYASGGDIVGNWSASGAVDGWIEGKVRGNWLDLQLSGQKISASLKLTASKCRQKMALSGKIGKIRKITVRLKKNC